MDSSLVQQNVKAEAVTCPICQWPIKSGEATTACPACHALYHQVCWQENGGCGVYGCSQVPPTQNLSSLEIPTSYWGQEEKPCPLCGKTILAAALRCRHCGATFASARPQDAGEFAAKAAMQTWAASARKRIIWLFVLSAIPLTAPFAAAFGLGWYLAHRRKVEAMPTIYSALCKVGLGLGILQVALLIVMGLMYSLFRRI